MAGLPTHRISALHRRHLSMGARMESEGAWLRPMRYTSAQEESTAVRSGVGLCDISPVGKLFLQGDDIDRIARAALPVADGTPFGAGAVAVAGALAVGKSNLSNTDGRSVPDLLMCRLAADQLMVLTAPDRADEARAALETQLDGCAHLVDLTSGLTGLCLSGPRSQDTLSKLTDMDLSLPATSNMTCSQTSLAKVQATIVRVDIKAVMCYQLYVSRDLGEYFWDALIEAGSSEGLLPVGVEALRLLQGEG